MGSLFAGVEGFGQGLEAAGFDVMWQVEIDRDCISVLERHYPGTHRVRDVREAGAHNLTPVDVITFGSPCQGFSVAGAQRGMEDARSGLFTEGIRIIRELRPTIAIWENVPGAFSSNDGRDFGAVLAALAESGALDIGWRVLDAQWFGVPQRRRRIFLVADFGGQRTAQILFEPTGSGWDSEACGEARQGAPGVSEEGAGSGGAANTLTANSGRCQVGMNYVAAPLTAGGHPDSNAPGRHREDDENLVAVAVSQNQRGEVRESDVAPALGLGGGKPGQGYPAVVIPISSDTAGGRSGDAKTPSPDGRGRATIRHPGLGIGEPGDPSYTLSASAMTAIATRNTSDTYDVMGYNTGIGEQTYAATEARSREVLCRMREAFGEEAFQQWGLRIVSRIQTSEVLRCDLHGQELRCSSESISGLGNDPLPRSEASSSGAMLRVLQAEWIGCPPYRFGPHEQFTRELGETLSKLPSEATQSAAFVSALRKASEGLRLLLNALPALQAVGRPEQDGDSGASGVQGVPGSGECSGVMRTALHASQEGEHAPVSPYTVRRLMPVEAERLMGWPDDWTRYRADGSEIPDGPRYRMIGNGVVAPVARWIGERLRRALECTS